MVVRILDVTLREAVLVEQCRFDDGEAVEIARELDASGIDLIEVGYVGGNPADNLSDPGLCPDRYLDRMRGSIERAQMSVIVHAAKVGKDVYVRLKKRGVDLVRFMTQPEGTTLVAEHALAAKQAGLLISINLIRATQHEEGPFRSVIEMAARVETEMFFLADSNGSLYPERLRQWLPWLGHLRACQLGLHPHNNISLAFANVLVALEGGFEIVDCSLSGLGKGGGNLSTEFMTAYLAQRSGQAFDVLRLADLSQRRAAQHVEKSHWPRFREQLSGLLDLNNDRLKALTEESRISGVPLERVLGGQIVQSISLKSPERGSRPGLQQEAT